MSDSFLYPQSLTQILSNDFKVVAEVSMEVSVMATVVGSRGVDAKENPKATKNNDRQYY